MMVEASSQDVSEEVVLDAMRRGHDASIQVIEMIDELVAATGKPKIEFQAEAADQELITQVDNLLNGRVAQILEARQDKSQMELALKQLEEEAHERLADDDHSKDAVSAAFEAILKKLMRARILEKGIRPDGRQLTEIRPISCEVGVLPRTHGSGLFTRGETQVLTIATLASTGMEQKVDDLSPEDTRRYMHHYNFLPFSTGEVKRINTGRREIGHGALAERAVEVVVPSKEDFPYAIRLVSESPQLQR